MGLSAAISGHVVRIAGWRRMFRAVMLSAVALCAQSGDWAQVQALAPGTRVEVKRVSGGKVHGTLASVSGDDLVVTRDAQEFAVARTDVRRVWLRSEKRSKRGRITGAIVGGAITAPCVLVCDGSGGARFGVFAVYTGLGYLVG